MGYILLSHIPEGSIPPASKHYRLLSRLLMALHNLIIKPVAEDDIYICHQIRRNGVDIQGKALPLLMSICGIGSYFAYYWKRKAVITITQLQTLQLGTVTCLQNIGM